LTSTTSRVESTKRESASPNARALIETGGGEMVVELGTEVFFRGGKYHPEHGKYLGSSVICGGLVVDTIAADLADIQSPTKRLLREYDKEFLTVGSWQPVRIIPDEDSSPARVNVAIRNNNGRWSLLRQTGIP
jgi:hypothetical protein